LIQNAQIEVTNVKIYTEMASCFSNNYSMAYSMWVPGYCDFTYY